MRQLILENCHESLIEKHSHLDSHELCSLTNVLDNRGDSTKLDNQIKSEIMIVIETYLSRPTIRKRLDEDTLKYIQKTVESQSYSRLPRVRSVARDLLSKLKHPETISVKRLIIDQGNDEYVYQTGNKLTRNETDRKERVYVSPRGLISGNGGQPPESKLMEAGESGGEGQRVGFNFQEPEEAQKALPKGVENKGGVVVDEGTNEGPAGVNRIIEPKKLEISLAESKTGKDQELKKSAEFPIQESVDIPKKHDPLPSSQQNQLIASQIQNVSAASFAFQSLQSGQSVQQGVDDLQFGASPQLRMKRDELKMKKQPHASVSNLRGNSPQDRELTETSALKRGLFLIEDPLLRMTRGKGWGPNIRAKNFLRKFSGLGPFYGGQGGTEVVEDSMQNEKLQERRETRSKQRNELQCMIGKNKHERSNSRSVGKFGLVDETEEKKRKKRLLYISKGIDPEDVNAEGKLKVVLEKEAIEEEEKSNPFLKRRN